MEKQIPSAESVRAQLDGMTMKQIDRLAELSGVPSTTIYKIKRGETQNPGVDTVRQFIPYIDAARQDPEAHGVASSEPQVASAG